MAPETPSSKSCAQFSAAAIADTTATHGAGRQAVQQALRYSALGVTRASGRRPRRCPLPGVAKDRAEVRLCAHSNSTLHEAGCTLPFDRKSFGFETFNSEVPAADSPRIAGQMPGGRGAVGDAAIRPALICRCATELISALFFWRVSIGAQA